MECMDRESMRKLQSERLVATVKRCYETVPFYKRKMDELGVKPEDIKGVDDKLFQGRRFVVSMPRREPLANPLWALILKPTSICGPNV